MDSRTKLLGHAVHPMLIVFPLGLLSASVIFDIIDRLRDSGTWAQTASATMAAGLIGGVVAAPFGLRDWLALPDGTRAKRVGLLHGGANVLVLALFFISWLLRRDDDPTAGALIVALAGLAVALVGAWLGGELIDRLGVGANRGADLDATSSLAEEPLIKI
jgi:uncharacterized membrane protein